MVKAQKISGRKALTLGVILSIGCFGSISNAGPKQSSGLSDFGGDDIVYVRERAAKAATDNTAAVARAEEVKKELEQNPGNTAAAQELQQINRGVDQRSQQTYGDADRFKDDRQMQQLATNVANTAKDWPHVQAYADRWAALAKPDSPEWAKAVNTGGLAASKAGDFKKAEASALRVLEKFPKDKDALFLYHASRGRGTAGAAPAAPAAGPAPTFARAPVQAAPFVPTPAAPNVKSYLDRAAGLIGMRDYRGAIGAAQRAATLDPSNPDPHMQQAVAWAALKNVSEAMLAISRAIERLAEGDPRLPGAYNTRALFKNKDGDYAGAASDADEALKRDPAMADAYYQRSVAQKGRGNNAESVADLKKAAELKPSDYKSLYDVAAREMADASGAPDPRRKSALQKSWMTILERAGGGLMLFVGGVGALLVLFAGYVFWFAKEGSTAGRFKTRWFTPSNAAGVEGLVIGGGRYEIREILGRGGMGTVNEGWDKELGRLVAVKSMNADLLSDEGLRRRFLEEAKLVARLRHPNIVDVYAIFDEPSGLFIVFAYVKGRTIHDLLNETPGRRLEPAYALELGLAIAKAIDYAHANDVIHRDLKPGNVMIDEHGLAKVMDFGIARRLDNARTTLTKVVVGTPVYMAPEQSWGVVTKQSDQFSLGVIMYEMLTGSLPFNGMGAQHDKIEGRFTPPSQLAPKLSAAVDEVFKKVLHPDYKQRYATCLEFRDALQSALRSPTPSP